MKELRVWFETQTAIFVTLQLCGLIDWSWWWVLSPLWIGTVVNVSLGLIIRAGPRARARRRIHRIING